MLRDEDVHSLVISGVCPEVVPKKLNHYPGGRVYHPVAGLGQGEVDVNQTIEAAKVKVGSFLDETFPTPQAKANAKKLAIGLFLLWRLAK